MSHGTLALPQACRLSPLPIRTAGLPGRPGDPPRPRPRHISTSHSTAAVASPQGHPLSRGAQEQPGVEAVSASGQLPALLRGARRCGLSSAPRTDFSAFPDSLPASSSSLEPPSNELSAPFTPVTHCYKFLIYSEKLANHHCYYYWEERDFCRVPEAEL